MRMREQLEQESDQRRKEESVNGLLSFQINLFSISFEMSKVYQVLTVSPHLSMLYSCAIVSFVVGYFEVLGLLIFNTQISPSLATWLKWKILLVSIEQYNSIEYFSHGKTYTFCFTMIFQTYENLWKFTFILTVSYTILVHTVYIIFGSSEVQPWNFIDIAEEEMVKM